MTKRSRLLVAIVLGLAAGACGDDSPYVAKDAGVEPDAPEASTFTKFVIDLISNHGSDPAPAGYETFKDLPDPDGDNNDQSAYSGLFQ